MKEHVGKGVEESLGGQDVAPGAFHERIAPGDQAGEGISTLAVGSIGVMNERPWEIDDPGLQLYDNIRVTHSPNGVIVIIR